MEKKGDIDFGKVVNGAVGVFFKDALRIAFTNPSQAFFFARTLRWQRKAAGIRSGWQKKGVHVPPILIFSVTSECNLNCECCYHHSLRGGLKGELSDERLRKAVAEAKELGISFIVIAGGEPLTRPSILDIPQDYPEIMFLMFTNGLLIDDAVLEKMKKERNVVPLISFEGYQDDTDARRGAGVYNSLMKAVSKLKRVGIFWGASLTMTRSNFDVVTDEGFVRKLVEVGCKLFMLVEYTPVREGTEDWVLTEEQRFRMIGIRNSFR